MTRRIGLLLIAGIAFGCAAPRLAVRPVRYELDVRLDPQTHVLAGRGSLDLERVASSESGDRRMAVELQLHPDLELESVESSGATILSRKARGGRVEENSIVPTTHRLIVERTEARIRLTFDYNGRLFQDVGVGEKEGQVHNFSMSAHIGEEGIYLGEGGHWYPRIVMPEDSDPGAEFADYDLTADPVEGFELVAGLESNADVNDGRLRWGSPFPLDGIVLLGGPLRRWSRTHGDVELHTVLDPSKEEVAGDILDAAAEYLDRYEPLIGDYPFSEFTVLEAFFSSGFAFPTCTQIAGSQLSARRQYRRHGYLDHELLHNWWGNGVFLDPEDGNWCEGLASYLGNYYGYVLDGDLEGARKERRNQSNFLSSIKPENDKPLGTFGLDDGAGRGLGYMKGAAVFHMLERKVGKDAFFAGLKRFAAEQMGRQAGWRQIQQALEHESGLELEPFFEQWVRRSGAPLIDLQGADWTPGADRMTVTISQEPTDFAIDVPLRLHYGERHEDVVVAMGEPLETVAVPCETSGLTAVELDPDYHLFRKLEAAETMPTSALTRRSSKLIIALPEGELSDSYQHVVDSFSRAVLGDEDDPRKGTEVLVRRGNEIDPDELLEASVLILGEAVRNPLVRSFLESTTLPVTWRESSFAVEGASYSAPEQAVFSTVHHPESEGNGVTVYYGNSTQALANARLLSYYANSLLVFETPPGDQSTDTGMPSTQVIRRMDFESHDRIDF